MSENRGDRIVKSSLAGLFAGGPVGALGMVPGYALGESMLGDAPQPGHDGRAAAMAGRGAAGGGTIGAGLGALAMFLQKKGRADLIPHILGGAAGGGAAGGAIGGLSGALGSLF